MVEINSNSINLETLFATYEGLREIVEGQTDSLILLQAFLILAKDHNAPPEEIEAFLVESGISGLGLLQARNYLEDRYDGEGKKELIQLCNSRLGSVATMARKEARFILTTHRQRDEAA